MERRTAWPLQEPLTTCLGPPLARPPAQDPEGFLKLSWGEQAWWVLELSGFNRCGLEGVLRLSVDQPRVDTSGLLVAGLPWRDGGVAEARRILSGELRGRAVSEWGFLDELERAHLLRALSSDPDPEALTVLIQLQSEHPQAPEIAAALERRRTEGPIAR